MDEIDFDVLMKIIIVGDSGVGKTNLLTRFAHQEFKEDSKPTVGVEFSTRNVEIKGKVIKAQVWDTAGQEKFRAITHAYYRGAVGAMICYDITKESTFQNVDKWVQEIEEHADENLIMMLVATKIDLEGQRIIRTEDGKQKAQHYNMAFLETSALKATNVVQAFTALLETIDGEMEKAQQDYIRRTSVIRLPPTVVVDAPKEAEKEKQKSCCG